MLLRATGSCALRFVLPAAVEGRHSSMGLGMTVAEKKRQSPILAHVMDTELLRLSTLRSEEGNI